MPGELSKADITKSLASILVYERSRKTDAAKLEQDSNSALVLLLQIVVENGNYYCQNHSVHGFTCEYFYLSKNNSGFKFTLSLFIFSEVILTEKGNGRKIEVEYK